MVDVRLIKEHMEIVAADGVHVGKVGCLEGDRIMLVMHDDEHGVRVDHNRYLPLTEVACLDAGRIWLVGRATEVQIVMQARGDLDTEAKEA